MNTLLFLFLSVTFAVLALQVLRAEKNQCHASSAKTWQRVGYLVNSASLNTQCAVGQSGCVSADTSSVEALRADLLNQNVTTYSFGGGHNKRYLVPDSAAPVVSDQAEIPSDSYEVYQYK